MEKQRYKVQPTCTALDQRLAPPKQAGSEGGSYLELQPRPMKPPSTCLCIAQATEKRARNHG